MGRDQIADPRGEEISIKRIAIILLLVGIGVYAAIAMIVAPPAQFKRQTTDSGRKLAYEKSISERPAPPSSGNASAQDTAAPGTTSPDAKDPIGALAAKSDQAAGPAANQPMSDQTEGADLSQNSWDAHVEAEPSDDAEQNAAVTASAEAPAGAPGPSSPLQGSAGADGAIPEAPVYSADANPPEAPAAEQAEPEPEWVEVAVSGARMQASADDDAPMLFAMPYGRRFRVLARDGDWVQVTDAQNKATGWTKVSELVPVGEAQPPAVPVYAPEDDGPGEWLERQSHGVASVIGRVFGGRW